MGVPHLRTARIPRNKKIRSPLHVCHGWIVAAYGFQDAARYVEPTPEGTLFPDGPNLEWRPNRDVVHKGGRPDTADRRAADHSLPVDRYRLRAGSIQLVDHLLHRPVVNN